jgi:hypothetical protein
MECNPTILYEGGVELTGPVESLPRHGVLHVFYEGDVYIPCEYLIWDGEHGVFTPTDSDRCADRHEKHPKSVVFHSVTVTNEEFRASHQRAYELRKAHYAK